MFLINSYHDLFHLVFFFFSFAVLHTLKTDSSKSLSLCNLVIEETPESGLAEEIQRSQIDLGAFIWGSDASTERVSQKTTYGGSQEDSACLSEAEQDVGLPTGMFPSADGHTVAEQGEHVPGPAPPCGDGQLSPKPMPEAECAIVACMETEQPYDLPDSEMPAMETGGLINESQEHLKKSEEEEEKQKTEDSVWAGVETCGKVDIGAIAIKTLEGTEGCEEKACESTGNGMVDLLKTIGKRDQETLKISEEETREDLRVRCKEIVKTNERYFEKIDISEKDMADEFTDRDKVLDERIQVITSNCEIIEGKPGNHTDCLNLPLQTDSEPNIENASPEGWDLSRKAIKKNLVDPPNHAMIYHSAQGGTDAEEIQCEPVLHAPEDDRDGNQAAYLSMKHELAAQSRTDLNYALEMNANRRDWCLCKAKDSLIEGSASTVTGNCSHTINLPRIAKTDSWGTDPSQILQPALDSAMNNTDILEFSGRPDGQASGFASCLDSINHWLVHDTGGLDKFWEHLDIVESKKALQVDLLADVCEEQAIDSCWEQSQETVRLLFLGTSQNVSTESSTSHQDDGNNNSDLSEDEIANQRYGLLYQEIGADKEEVLTQYVV